MNDDADSFLLGDDGADLFGPSEIGPRKSPLLSDEGSPTDVSDPFLGDRLRGLRDRNATQEGVMTDPPTHAPIAPASPTHAPIAPASPRVKRRGAVLRLMLILIALFIVGGVSVAAPFASKGGILPIGQHTSAHHQAATPPRPVPTATPMPRHAKTPTIPAGQVLQLQVPAGWGNHSQLSAENALQVGWTFTQREMRIDYRAVGTLAQKGGTLTASVFLLDAAARQLRFPNDRRSTAAFFALVQQERLIQTPVFDDPPFFTSHAQILQARQLRGNFFVWVSVPFLLATQRGEQGQPTLDLDPGSGQPRVHTLLVLLIAVPLEVGPMGGIDFEVSDYALDEQGLPPIPAQP